jgi:membrane dipeptidase
MIQSPPIVDAHLDLAYNVTRGRDPRMPAKDQPRAHNEIATVGLPDLRAGGVDLICATIFAMPSGEHAPGGYRDTGGAHAQALAQLGWYRQQFDDGVAGLITGGTGFQPVRGSQHALQTRATGQQMILLMEGADPIRTPADVQFFFNAGVRIVGLAWKQTRYSGGTGVPGPLSPAGVELVKELDRFGIIHDASHLAEESFWQLMKLTSGPVIASHSNCRAIVPGDRHLTDDMLREIARRGGVIGINFFDKFLLPPAEYGTRRATLVDVARHMRHICDLTGSSDYVGIGTDMDGGLGREQIPVEIETSADLGKLAGALTHAGFADAQVAGVMGENWRRYFSQQLR